MEGTQGHLLPSTPGLCLLTNSELQLQTLPALPCPVLKYLFKPWGEPERARSLGWKTSVWALRSREVEGPCISKAALTFYRLMALLVPEIPLK